MTTLNATELGAEILRTRNQIEYWEIILHTVTSRPVRLACQSRIDKLGGQYELLMREADEMAEHIAIGHDDSGLTQPAPVDY